MVVHSGALVVGREGWYVDLATAAGETRSLFVQVARPGDPMNPPDAGEGGSLRPCWPLRVSGWRASSASAPSGIWLHTSDCPGSPTSPSSNRRHSSRSTSASSRSSDDFIAFISISCRYSTGLVRRRPEIVPLPDSTCCRGSMRRRPELASKCGNSCLLLTPVGVPGALPVGAEVVEGDGWAGAADVGGVGAADEDHGVGEPLVGERRARRGRRRDRRSAPRPSTTRTRRRRSRASGSRPPRRATAAPCPTRPAGAPRRGSGRGRPR